MPSIESRGDLFSIDRLKSIFRYDEDTGHIYIINSDNYRCSKTPLGIIDNGYVVILYCGYYVFSHRLAFALKLGRWPIDEVDHIDRIKTNNRWLNLREASRLDNVVNRGLRKDNSTGITGVSVRRSGSFRVRIDGVRLGDYKDFFEACCARKSAELKSEIRNKLSKTGG